MTKELYLAVIATSQKNINEQRECISRNTQEYIQANRQFADGEKIKIVIPERTLFSGRVVEASERFAFVIGAGVNGHGNIIYNLKAAKKDGTISKQSDFASPEFLTKL